jgi:catechol 2,3-dioxygenase-like lactoylglutathione lyase family enzyme
MATQPKPCLTVVTLGVADMARSIRFYDALGFARRMKATGEQVAFFDAGGVILGLYPWDKLAEDATLPDQPRPQTFRGVTLAWNRASPAEVDAAMAHALGCGGRLLKKPHKTFYGGYSGYFADPDDHAWEVLCAPGIEVGADGRVSLPD